MNSQRFKDLAERFLTRTAEDVLLLKAHHAALQTGNSAALLEMQQLAHRINGSSAMLGFKSISTAAARIESLARQRDLAEQEMDWHELQHAMQTLEQALLAQQVAGGRDGKRDGA